MAEITLHSNVAQKMQELSKRRTESQQRPDLSKLDPPRLPPLSETPSSPKPPESPKNLEQILLKPSEPVEQPEKKKKKRKVRKLKWKKVNKTKLSMNESSMFSSDSQVSSLNESLANSKLNTTKKRRIRKVKKIRK